MAQPRKIRAATLILFLVLAQTATIAYLAARIAGVDARTERLARDISSVASDLAGKSDAPTQSRIAAAAAARNDTPGEAQLRAIIRSELAAVEERLQSASASAAAAPSNVQAIARSTALDPQTVTARLTEYETIFASLRAKGRASPAELASLESAIAKLPPDERSKALAELNRAVNRGQIDARF